MHRCPESFKLRCAALLASALLSGCMSVPVPELPAQVPGAWSQAAGEGARAVDLRSWWTALDDPRLNALVEEALRRNLDLEQSARLLQGEREVAGRWRSRYLPGFGVGARPVQDAQAKDSYFHASIDMVWELGLFGAAESSRLQAGADADLAAAREQGLRVSVVAAVVRNYLDLGVANGQIALLTQMAELDREAERLAQVRLNTRLGTPQDADTASVRRQRTLAALASMRLAADRSARALALLLGRDAPDPGWSAVAPSQGLPGFALGEVPADLLRTRPDIREAEAEVLRAAARLGMARSALYPRLSLGGSVLYAYNMTQNHRSNNNFVPAGGPTIDIPLWDWGARQAQVKAGEQGIAAALAGYRKAVLSGVSEVEESLSALARERERIAALDEARRVLDRRNGSQRKLASLGLSSPYDGLEGRRALLEAQSDVALARGARTLAFVALYKALGGAPLAPQPQPEQQAQQQAQEQAQQPRQVRP